MSQVAVVFPWSPRMFAPGPFLTEVKAQIRYIMYILTSVHAYLVYLIVELGDELERRAEALPRHFPRWP